ncbi:TonB-dependent receptor domain-containing protein [Oligella urethralis]|uniref:TonB-dependent receptor domain-containing protein n=1 Tax=Oligella urethralis TaxID=90245 RepID=UPI00243020BB|nr:TonB-dependent receptor [Oligella urethralis]
MQRNTYTLEHRFNRDDIAWLDWKLNLYANRNKLTDYQANRSAKTNAYGGSAKNSFKAEYGDLYNQLTVGADYHYEEGETNGLMGPRFLGTKKKTTDSKNLGLFIQNELQFKRLRVGAGLRFDRYSTDYGPYHMSDSHFSPNISAELELAYGFSVDASHARAVRGSGSIPMGFLTRVDDKTNFNNGQPLKAEKSKSTEFGLSFKKSGVFTQYDALSARASYFNTHIDNMIEWVGGGMTYPAFIRNMPGTLRTKGWDIRLSWSIPQYQTTLALTKADVTADGKPLGVVRRKGAALGDRLTWSHRWQVNEEISLAYHLNAVRRNKDVPGSSIERPGYALHDTQAQWEPKAVPGLSLNFAVHNLTDKRYSSHTSIAFRDSETFA